MLCFLNDSTDAAFNLAAEEYLLHHCQEDCCMLWRCRRAIIIGRNQNPWSQVSVPYVQRHGIPVLRRLSGGGTVYQDAGNINFSFVRRRSGPPSMDFGPFLEPVIAFLKNLGLAVTAEQAGALMFGGEKISGNAQFIHRDRILHHGTLLFDADLPRLRNALADNTAFYRDAGVDSIRRPVTNIKPFVPFFKNTSDFMSHLFSFIRKATRGRQAMLLPADRRTIEALAQRRYRTWRWNFGRSPAYHMKKTVRAGNRRLASILSVRGGLIRRIHVIDADRPEDEITDLDALLTGCRHTPSAVLRAVAEAPCPFAGITPEELVAVLF